MRVVDGEHLDRELHGCARVGAAVLRAAVVDCSHLDLSRADALSGAGTKASSPEGEDARPLGEQLGVVGGDLEAHSLADVFVTRIDAARPGDDRDGSSSRTVTSPPGEKRGGWLTGTSSIETDACALCRASSTTS